MTRFKTPASEWEWEMIIAIFAWFTRIGERGDHALGGLGIWPCLTSGLLKVQDGSMIASIEGPGERSEFVLRQPPVADIPAAPLSPSPSLSPEPKSFKPACRRILVVDDNIDAARSLAKVLTLLHGQNAEVDMRPLGPRNGRSVPPRHRPPGYWPAGHEWSRGGRAVTPQALVQGMPAGRGHRLGQEKDRATSRAAGFDHHLVKPVNQTTIQNLLHGNLPPDH